MRFERAFSYFSGGQAFKVCSKCGQEYTEVQWQALPLIGHQVMEAYAPENDPGEVLELKNCSCGSTLAVQEPFTAIEVDEEVERARRGHPNAPIKVWRQLAIEALKKKRG